MVSVMGIVFLIFANYLMSKTAVGSGLQLSIIHINDFHARFEEMTPSMGTCKINASCIGGFSRMYTLINQLYQTRPNPISLNAGDNFQGTIWYNMFKWNVTQFFLNMLPTDAMTLGNHEFDDGLEGIVPFLKAIRVPVVLSNIDDTLEPSIQNLYKKSIVIEREGKKIGIIGVLTSGTKDVSNTGQLSFLDEVESINREARRLLDIEGVFTVIVISHCGFESETKMAKLVINGISIIVGGHSNTLLYNGEPPIGTATGEYPTVIESVNNHTVLIIQADCFSRYVGNLSVEYDTSGEVISWDGNPIYLDQNIPKNESIETLLDYYREQINKISNCVLGKTNVLLDHASCLSSECNLGNLITDSMIAYYSNQSDGNSWSKTAVAIINSGAIRSSISKGDISLKDLQNALPFEDRMVYGELQGKHIKTVMETSTAPYFYRKINLQLTLIQVSGLRLVLDQSQPIGSRVVSMKIRCHACDVPAYEDVDSNKYYPIALTKYLANGGDGHHTIKDNLRNSSEGPVFCDIISEYIKKQSPIIIGLDERIIVKRSN